MAGYSGTPLAQKLGIRPGARVGLVNAPAGFEAELVPLPEGATVHRDPLPGGTCDVVLFFPHGRADLDGAPLSGLAALVRASGGLWIAWPKKASGVQTDLSEEAVRQAGLAMGLVDNKVCAIDAIWSGLRFVLRLADR